MTVEQLKVLIDKHNPLSIRRFDQRSYKIGENAGIYRQAKKEEPDNRVPTPYIRRAVKIVKGYFARPGNITYSDSQDWFAKNLYDIYDQNDEELHTGAMFEDAMVYGASYEIHRYDKDTGFEFGLIPIEQAIPIYDDSLKPKIKEFVWVRKIDGTEIATWFDAVEYIDFVKGKNGKWVQTGAGKHLYGAVPVLEATIDRDKRNLFDHVLPLIDLYDKILSGVGDEHEKFAESILLLRDAIDGVNRDETGLTDVDKLNRWRVLDRLGDNVATSAQYLERNVNDTFINNTLDRLERLIYEMLCLFNPNDDNFGVASGIAQEYKLLSFEYLVSDMESYFSKFLQARIRLLAGHALGPGSENVDSVIIHFTRNLPFDIERMAGIVTTLSGGKQVLSTTSLRKLFPFTMVADNEEELIKAENPPMASPYSQW